MKKESGLEFVYAFEQQQQQKMWQRNRVHWKTMPEMHENKMKKEYFGIAWIFVGFISLLMDNGFNLKEFCFNFVGMWTVLPFYNQKNYVFQNLMDFSTV